MLVRGASSPARSREGETSSRRWAPGTPGPIRWLRGMRPRTAQADPPWPPLFPECCGQLVQASMPEATDPPCPSRLAPAPRFALETLPEARENCRQSRFRHRSHHEVNFFNSKLAGSLDAHGHEQQREIVFGTRIQVAGSEELDERLLERGEGRVRWSATTRMRTRDCSLPPTRPAGSAESASRSPNPGRRRRGSAASLQSSPDRGVRLPPR